MLKIRIVAVLVIKGGIVVQSMGFKRYLPIGSPAIAIEYLNSWGIDEIVYLDIDATHENRRPQFDNIRDYSKYCHVPLAVGGGIKDVDDIKKLIHAGADKILLNTEFLKNPKLVSKGAELFGNQCIVVSIDARRLSEGNYETYVNSGTIPTGYTPAELAKRAEDMGAGEILITSIDRDGSKKGYDIELVRQVVNVVNIPVIVCGGVGYAQHLQEGANLGASAVAAANFFHYSEHSVTTVKSCLKAANVNIRLDSYTTYHNFLFDSVGRIQKKDEALLERLYVEYIPEEVI
jgi:imidazole glycerol-phosphate synthase subunit HisF